MSLDQARKLRSDMTEAEKRLWYRLRAHRFEGFKFKRQVPIGPYIVDFACVSRRLVVEVDGGQHSESEKDRIRDAWLKEQGLYILRFWNHDVLANTDAVLEKIMKALFDTDVLTLSRRAPRATLSPSGRGESRH